MQDVTFESRFNKFDIGSTAFGKQVIIGNCPTIHHAENLYARIEKKINITPNVRWRVSVGYSVNWSEVRVHDHDWLAYKVAHDFVSKHVKPVNFNMMENLFALAGYFELMEFSYGKIEKHFKETVGPTHPAITELFGWIRSKTQTRYKSCAKKGYFLYKNGREGANLYRYIFARVIKSVQKICSSKLNEEQMKQEDVFRRIRLARGVTLEEQEVQRQKTLTQLRLSNRDNILNLLKAELASLSEQIGNKLGTNEVGYIHFCSTELDYVYFYERPKLSNWSRTKIGSINCNLFSVCDSAAHSLMKIGLAPYYRGNFSPYINEQLTPDAFSGLKVGLAIGSVFTKLSGNDNPKEPLEFRPVYLYTRKCVRTGVVVEFFISTHKASLSRSNE